MDTAALQTQMGNMEKRIDAQASDMRGEMGRMGSDMNRMRDEMRLEMEQLNAQNQLLLSKISALSSQNSNAPGIFDGADRRKLEAKHEQLRQSGQKVAPTVRHRQLAFFDMECEFFKNCDTDCSQQYWVYYI